MILKQALTATLVLGLASAAAVADTLYFKDGSSLDGTVTQPDSNSYVIEFDKGKMYFKASEVARWVKNNNEGSYNVKTLEPRVAEPDTKTKPGAEAREDTLTADQKNELSKIAAGLSSSDPKEVVAAQDALMAKKGDMDVFSYLQSSLTKMKGRSTDAALELMMKLDPTRAQKVVESETKNPVAGNRAKALELLSKSGGKESVSTLARGMVDVSPAVQKAAASCLGQTGDKGVTPALLAGLKSSDQSVRDASVQALRTLWNGDKDTAGLSSPADWQQFWASRASQYKDALRTDNLLPLVTKAAVEQEEQKAGEQPAADKPAEQQQESKSESSKKEAESKPKEYPTLPGHAVVGANKGSAEKSQMTGAKDNRDYSRLPARALVSPRHGSKAKPESSSSDTDTTEKRDYPRLPGHALVNHD